MLDIISAMDDFFSFGSAEKLVAIYHDSNNILLSKLVESLKTFSEHLSLCRVSELENDIQAILTHFAAYQNSKQQTTDTSDYNEAFFEILIDRIQSEFEFPTNNVCRNVSICEWCCNKGLLQQALSIINENFPVFICKHITFTPYQESVKTLIHNSKHTTCARSIFNGLTHLKDESGKAIEEVTPAILAKHIQYNESQADMLCTMLNCYKKIVKERNAANHASLSDASYADITKLIQESIAAMRAILSLPQEDGANNLINTLENPSDLCTPVNIVKLPMRTA